MLRKIFCILKAITALSNKVIPSYYVCLRSIQTIPSAVANLRLIRDSNTTLHRALCCLFRPDTDGTRVSKCGQLSQQTRRLDPMLFQCWSSAVGGGPILKQHWVKCSRLLGSTQVSVYTHPSATIIFSPADQGTFSKTAGQSQAYYNTWNWERGTYDVNHLHILICEEAVSRVSSVIRHMCVCDYLVHMSYTCDAVSAHNVCFTIHLRATSRLRLCGARGHIRGQTALTRERASSKHTKLTHCCGNVDWSNIRLMFVRGGWYQERDSEDRHSYKLVKFYN